MGMYQITVAIVGPSYTGKVERTHGNSKNVPSDCIIDDHVALTRDWCEQQAIWRKMLRITNFNNE